MAQAAHGLYDIDSSIISRGLRVQQALSVTISLHRDHRRNVGRRRPTNLSACAQGGAGKAWGGVIGHV